MLNRPISKLSNQEILNMELESLAYLFLLDRSKVDIFPVTDFIRDITKKERDNTVKRVLCEAFQWLYNNGYIMLDLADVGSGYRAFVTRAGKKWLDEKSSLEKSGYLILQD